MINLFANPVFVYAVSFLFKRDEAGATAIKAIFFFFGLIAPILIQVLSSIGGKKKDVADVLKWFFYPVPIFSLCSGF